MKYESTLKKLGLSEKEIIIYLDLIEYNISSITDIQRRTKLHRPDVYKYLPVLKDMWLVSIIPKWKRQMFTAESPKKLKNLLSNLIDNMNIIIPELDDKFQNKRSRPIVKFLEWTKWISYVFSDIVETLNKWDIFYRISSSKNIEKANDYLPSNYRKIRDKKQLERFVIMSKKWASEKKTTPRTWYSYHTPKTWSFWWWCHYDNLCS